MRDRRYVEDLSTEELEQALLVRRREERLARLRRMGAGRASAGRAGAGRAGAGTLVIEEEGLLNASSGTISGGDGRAFVPAADSLHQKDKEPLEVWRERILLAIEGLALVGLVVVVISLLVTVRNLNLDWRQEQQADALPLPTATALIRAAVLPGGHKPPVTQGGEAQPLGPVPSIAIPTPGPRSPTRLVISSIHVDVPVVEGDDWEQLKKGAGHHIGSANPGERGNCFISGHNDVYGEIFRHLQEVKVGDEIVVYAGDQLYRYRVRATRIVEPDDVSVMYPTSSPVLTLLTCYPYMIDSHRLVVIAELDR
jgi:sortase A